MHNKNNNIEQNGGSMKMLSFTRDCRFDTKWINLHQGNKDFFNIDHTNPYYEIIIVIQGPVYLELNQEKLVLSAGDCIILNPWEKHRGWKESLEYTGFYWVQFSAIPTIKSIDTLNISSEISQPKTTDLRTSDTNEIDICFIPRYSKPRQRYKLLSLFEALYEEMLHPKGYYRFRANVYLYQILDILATDLLNTHEFDTTLPYSFITYRRLVNYLDEWFHTEIDRERLEQHLDRKYEYLCQIFKKYSGITITKYIQQLRVQRAKYLLNNNSMNIQEIAAEIGYKDPFYFSKVFKKMIGASPDNYRLENTRE